MSLGLPNKWFKQMVQSLDSLLSNYMNFLIHVYDTKFSPKGRLLGGTGKVSDGD